MEPDATQRLQQRIEANPGDVDARTSLAVAMFKAGDEAGAAREMLNCARVLLHGGDVEEALRCCRDSIAVAPEDPDARMLLAELLAREPSLHEELRIAKPRVMSASAPLNDDSLTGEQVPWPALPDEETVKQELEPPRPSEPAVTSRNSSSFASVAAESLDDDADAMELESLDDAPAAAGGEALPAAGRLSANDVPRNALFDLLDGGTVERFLSRAQVVTYSNGEPLLHAGQAVDRVMLVLSGIATYQRLAEGSEPTRLEAGDWIASFEFAAELEVPVTVFAEGSTKVLELSRDAAAKLRLADRSFDSAMSRRLESIVVDDVLRNSPLFHSLSSEQREDLRERFFTLDVQSGEVILKKQGINRRLFVVLSGQLVVESRGIDRQFHRMPLRAGDFFGFVSTVLGRAMQVSVHATDDARLVVLPEQEVYRMVAANKGVARAARREAVERGDAPISVHRVSGMLGLEVRRPAL
ncbi:MAG: CRP-like cAMP-binding protein [Bradymonadia bacterium]|jgi:CRP-like cAMP-binding protein